MASITWASSTTSSTPPQTDSDTYTLPALTTSAGASFTANGVTGGAGNGINGLMHLQFSPDGSTWTTVASQSVLAIPNHSVNYTISQQSTSGYLYARLAWALVTYDQGYFNAGTWNSTQLNLPIVAPVLPQATVVNQIQPVGPSGNPNPFGIDINCLTDLDPYFSLVGGIQCLAQDLYHTVTCNTGSLFWAPDRCFNSVGLLSQATDQSELSVIQSNLTNAITADERVQACTVLLQFNSDTEALTATINVQPLSGLGVQPFQFVASISQVGNALLSVT